MSEERPIEAAGELELADVIRFQYFHFAKTRWIPICTIATLAFSIFGLAAVLSTGDPERLRNPGSYYLIFPIFALLAWAAPYFAARKQFAKIQWLREPMRYRFDDEGPHVAGPSFSGTIVWKVLPGIHETKTLFIVYQTSQAAWIIPKRFFWGDERELTRFRSFAIAHLAEPGKFHSIVFPGKWL
jgi:hypothetical protein